LDDVINKIDDLKNKGLTNLDKIIQPLIDSKVKMYKKLQSLATELTQQKSYVVGEYQMDIDEYMTNNLQARYNRSQYLALKAEVDNFKSMYYTTTNQLNCSSILSATDMGTSLLAKITTMNAAVSS